jgi:hypothetical protein
MNRRPLYYISRNKEQELIDKLITLVDNRNFNPNHTAVIQASVEFASTAAMHLAHAWSVKGEVLPIIPIEVTYPGESYEYVISKFRYDMDWHLRQRPYKNFVVVEAGIIRGGNWKWILEEFEILGYSRNNITLVTLCENIHSAVKSDYVGEYYDDTKEDLTFYFEKYNKHWPTN